MFFHKKKKKKKKRKKETETSILIIILNIEICFNRQYFVQRYICITNDHGYICPFVFLLLVILLSVLLRITASDYPFGTFKPLFYFLA
jgi:hypothetical protein